MSPQTAATAVESVAPINADAAPRTFFSVSVTKLCVLSFLSFGAYTLYWFYQHWKIVRDRHGENVSPIARTILSNFYGYALFTRMLARGKEASIASTFPAGLCAVGWFVSNMLLRLPEPYWLVSTLSFVWLVPAQHYANRLNQVAAPHQDRYARFSGWNKALVGFGVVWWLLVLLGLSVPEAPPNEPKPRSRSPVAMQPHVPGDALAFVRERA